MPTGEESLSRAELDIASSFFPFLDEIKTTKEIERETAYSHERVHNILQKLEKEGFLSKKNLGNVNIFKFNGNKRESFFIYLYYLEKKKARLASCGLRGDLHEFINRNKKDFLSILFFENSINYEKKEINFFCLGKCSAKNGMSKGCNLDYAASSIEELRVLNETNPELYKQIIEKAIVLTGADHFYSYIYNGGKIHV